MNNEYIQILNNLVSSNYNNLLFDILNKLENIISDLSNNSQINVIIKQIRNIIIILNKIVNDNQFNLNILRKDIKELNQNITNNFKLINILDNFKMESEMEKEYIIIKMEVNMMVILKMDWLKAMVQWYILEEIDMKGIGKMIFQKEMEYTIIKVVQYILDILKMD